MSIKGSISLYRYFQIMYHVAMNRNHRLNIYAVNLKVFYFYRKKHT